MSQIAHWNARVDVVGFEFDASVSAKSAFVTVAVHRLMVKCRRNVRGDRWQKLLRRILIVQNRIGWIFHVRTNRHGCHHTQTWWCGQTVGRIEVALFRNLENAHELGVWAANNVFIDAQLRWHKVQFHFEWHFQEVNVLKMSVFMNTLVKFIEFQKSILCTDDGPSALAHCQLVRLAALALNTTTNWKWTRQIN